MLFGKAPSAYLSSFLGLPEAWRTSTSAIVDPMVAVATVVWSDFLRNKTDRKLAVMPQTYPDPIKKPLLQRM